MAYLKEKPELEYTGLESFVNEKYRESNNTWFPIYKAGSDRFSQSNLHNHEDKEDGENEDSNNDDSDESDNPNDR